MKLRWSNIGWATAAFLLCGGAVAQAHGPLSVLEVLAWASEAPFGTCGSGEEVPRLVRTSVGPAVLDDAGGYALLCPSRIGPSPTHALAALGPLLASPVSGGVRASWDGGCTFGSVTVPPVEELTPLVTEVVLALDGGQLAPVDHLLVVGRTPDRGLLGTLRPEGELAWVLDWPREEVDETPRALLPTTAFAGAGAGRWWVAGLFPTPRLALVQRLGDDVPGPSWRSSAVEPGPSPPPGLAAATQISGLDMGADDGLYLAMGAQGDSPWARLWWRHEVGAPWVERWAGASLLGPVLAADRVWWVGDGVLWVDDPRGVTWIGKRAAPAPVAPIAVAPNDWTCLTVTPLGHLAGCVQAGVVVLDPQAPDPPAVLRMGLEQLRLHDPWCEADAAGQCAADAAHAQQEYPELVGEAARCPGDARTAEVAPPDATSGTGCTAAPRSGGVFWAWWALALAATRCRRP